MCFIAHHDTSEAVPVDPGWLSREAFAQSDRRFMNNIESDDFRNYLKVLLGQFKRSLQGQLTHRTIRRHVTVIGVLIDYLSCDCGVCCFEAIRRGMVCSRFRQWYCTNMQDCAETQVNTSVKKFFTFLVCEKGIAVGQDVLTGLKIKCPVSVRLNHDE